MSRKFNIGRQNDLLLNDKMHDLYAHLEFINYKDGDGNTITMPRQTKQTEIPVGALWLQHPLDTNMHKLRVLTDPMATDMEDRWPCLFEGYYHPASITGLAPENPVQGQIWIDEKNVLYVCDMSTGLVKWNPVATKVLLEEDTGYFVGMDYQNIDPLLPLFSCECGKESAYQVPFESYGKFYAAKEHADEYQYCHPPVNESLKETPYYDMHNHESAISITDDNTEAYKAKKWVHINPINLNKVTKRLVKINKPTAFYQRMQNHIKLPKYFYDYEENKDKTFESYLVECIVNKEDKNGFPIKVVYMDDENRLVNINSLYETMPIAEGDEDILDDNYDSGMNENTYQEIPDDDYDSGMNVEPLDPNPIPGDDYDSGMNEDTYQEIPDDEYDSGMNVEPLDPNPVPDSDYDSDMNVGWELPNLKEIRIFQVVPDNTSIRDIEPGYMIKSKFANKMKYTQAANFAEGEYVQLIEVTDSNTGFIHIPNGCSGTTEFFAFRSSTLNNFDDYDNKIGRLLKCYNVKDGIEDPSMGSKDKEDDTVKSEYEQNLELRNDYSFVQGGIKLADRIIEEYDYIYAITYEFKPQHSKDGNLIRITKSSLEGPDQIYIGACGGTPVVFMDGLYLEHRYDNGSEVYTYDDENITFSGNNVLDEMQILVVSFPKVNNYYDKNGIEHPQEYTISADNIRNRYDICASSDEGALQVTDNPTDTETQISLATVTEWTPDLKGIIDGSGDFYVRVSETKDAVIQGEFKNGKWDSLFDKENFPNPLIFYNGLAGYTYAAFPKDYIEEDEVDIHIDYENHYVTIHNFGSIVDANGTSAIFAVSLGENNYKNSGILEGGVIYDENIYVDKPYLVIVDGIVMSPYNEDITVEEGKITITDASIALNSEYTVIELTDINDDSIDDTDAIICIYDDKFTPYSIPIMNPKAMNTSNAYDDCDSAVVMCGPGVLVDREAFQKDFDPDTVYVGGQIVKERLKTANKDELYEWRQYTHSNEYVVLDPIDDGHIIADCEKMITYHMNTGTVLLNPVNIDDQPVTVYAYTYVDHIDERLLRGQRLIPIEVPKHSNNPAGHTMYSTNRTHLYDVGKQALSTYINGIMVPHIEEPTNNNKGDLFFVGEIFSSYIKNDNGDDMYSVLMAIDDETKLEDEIYVETLYGLDPCLVIKYFNSEHQLAQAKALKKYILEDMRNNKLLYFIENVESNESAACRRQWDAPRTDNGNLPNSYMTTMRLMPGIINVYVNGVLLEKDDYAIYDNNKIMIGFDLVGGQEHVKAIKDKYKHPYRVMTEEGFKYIECENNDEVLIEVRDDLTLKKRSYIIEDVSYETGVFDTLDYDFPRSLCSTKDIIKIYINGVLYDGDYTNNEGVITLLEHVLDEDPLYAYLKTNLSAMAEYEEKYGKYVKHEDIITFEWR